MARFTNTCGGGIDQTAVIGHAPEMREWRDGDTAYLPTIHPTARIEAFVSVDAGKNRNTFIGARSWLMKHVHVGHDVQIGEDCELAPGAVIGGYCLIGDRVKIGLNACVKPCVTIGDGARIGMGAVVIRDVPPGATVAGNPARPLRRADRPEEGMEIEIEDPLVRWLSDRWRRFRAAVAASS